MVPCRPTRASSETQVLFVLVVCVSWGCNNKRPHPGDGGYKKQKFILTVLQARYLKARYRQGTLPGTLWGSSSWPLCNLNTLGNHIQTESRMKQAPLCAFLASGGCQPVGVVAILVSSLPCCHMAMCLYCCVFRSSYKDSSRWI
jgi:hypothetical protein